MGLKFEILSDFLLVGPMPCGSFGGIPEVPNILHRDTPKKRECTFAFVGGCLREVVECSRLHLAPQGLPRGTKSTPWRDPNKRQCTLAFFGASVWEVLGCSWLHLVPQGIHRGTECTPERDPHKRQCTLAFIGVAL